MSRSKHTEAEMIAAVKQMEAGRRAEDVAREVGVSTHTIYAWKSKYGGMDVSEAGGWPTRDFRVPHSSRLYRDEWVRLGSTGNRTGATEQSGRTETWGYDGIYRLTGETIASDPSPDNGTVSYTLDPVGNRTQQTSSISGIPSISSIAFNADDMITGESYDSNGNTTVSVWSGPLLSVHVSLCGHLFMCGVYGWV